MSSLSPALFSLDEWDRLSSDKKRRLALEVEQQLPMFGKVLTMEEAGFLNANDDDDEEEEGDDDDHDDDEEREANEQERAELRKKYPVTFQGLRTFQAGDQEHEMALFTFTDGECSSAASTTLVLVPGGTVELGYSPDMYSDFPSKESLDDYEERYVQGLKWPPLSDYLSECMSERRQVTLSPFLFDQSPQHDDGIAAGDDSALEDLINKAGWSLPTEDEWEWAYRGGTQLMFPSGNDYVYINNPAEEDYNAFGIEPPESTYNVESIADGGQPRGGDGGICECGGYNGLVWTILHACAYTNPSELQTYSTEGPYYRRCFRILNNKNPKPT